MSEETVQKAKSPVKPRVAAMKADAPAKAAAPKETVAKKAVTKKAVAKKAAATTKVANPVEQAAATVSAKHEEPQEQHKPSHHEIAQLAERFWVERGWQDGHAEQDWLRAEQTLQAF